jgi:polyisoprenoid-binding protein YceI
MSKLFLTLKIAFVFFISINHFGYSQKTFKLEGKPALAVSGTSSLHDWSMPSTTATGTLIATEAAGKLDDIKSLTVEMPAESIKSGKKGMDKKAYEALKTESHKTVKFDLKSASKSGDVWTLTGTFTIAGTTKTVSLKAKETSANGTHGLSGSYSFKLSDYNITPPTALMGTVKTGNDVKITFDVKFK